jgi:hypothetical protein
MWGTLRLLRVRALRRSCAFLCARRRRGRRVTGGALLLLLTLPRLRFGALTLLRFALLLLLLLCGAILLFRRRRHVRGREVRLPRLRWSEVALVPWGVGSEYDACVERSLADCRRAVRWRRLMRGRHAVDPDAAHSRRRPMALGHTARTGLCVECRRRQCEAGEEYCETLHGAPRVV